MLTFVPADPPSTALRRPGGGWALGLQVDDIHGYHERVRLAGRARFEQDLELMMPGVWQFSVVDNNGYFIGFSQPNRRA